MTAPAASCPECGGAQWPDDPRGMLLLDHTNTCTLRAAEDSTHLADHDRLAWSWGGYARPATDAEQTLLVALGWEFPADLNTHVEPITGSKLRRTWTQLTTPITKEIA